MRTWMLILMTAGSLFAAGMVKNIGPGVVAYPKGLRVAAGDTLFIRPGTTVKIGIKAGIVIRGAMIASGTNIRPIFFTSMLDDKRGGDTDRDGGVDFPMPGEWGPIAFMSGSKAVLHFCHFHFLGGIRLHARYVEITKCGFHNCSFEYMETLEKKLFIRGGTISYQFTKKEEALPKWAKKGEVLSLIPKRTYIFGSLGLAGLASGVVFLFTGTNAKAKYDNYRPGNPKYDAATPHQRSKEFNRLRDTYLLHTGTAFLLGGTGIINGVFGVRAVIKFRKGK